MDNKINIKPIIDEKVFLEFQRINKERNGESLRAVPILEAKNVVKKYGENIVIPNLNFKIEDIVGKSEIISILGPSGCGKSTILKLIAGLESPTSGEIDVEGKPVKGPGMDRGMIFQKYSSFPFLNVIENISYPLIKVKKIKKSLAYDEAKYWIDKMSLKGAEYKYPHQLSGGMQQRVAIARTLCMKTRIILMDEPFGALDRKIRWEMQDLIAEILFFKPVQEVTVLLVTHDVPEAVYLGDTVWVINRGEIFKKEFVERPKEPARIAQSKKDFQDIVTFFNEEINKLQIKV